MVYHRYVGLVAIIAAIYAFITNKRFNNFIALFFSVGSLILTNTFLGSIGFIIVVYMFTKKEIN